MSDEADDIRAALNGDGSAYERIIRRHQQAIGRRMLRFTRDRREAEELTHDVFVEAYVNLRSFRGESPFEHWLQRIATRTGYKFWKRRGKNKAVELEVAEAVPTRSSAASDDLAEEVHRKLEQLPPRDRMVLTLLYVEERSVAEAAELIGWTQTMVKVQAFRARGKLKKLIEGSRP